MTHTEIANLALGHIGESTIADYDEQTPVAEVIRTAWANTRDVCLRMFRWNFATARVALSSVDPPADESYGFAYQLPADYLRCLQFNGVDAGHSLTEFRIEGTTLLSDEETANLRYIRRIENPAEWDPSFVRAFSFKLAATVAPRITTSSAVADRLNSAFTDAIADAKQANAIESRPTVVLATERSRFVEAGL